MTAATWRKMQALVVIAMLAVAEVREVQRRVRFQSSISSTTASGSNSNRAPRDVVFRSMMFDPHPLRVMEFVTDQIVAMTVDSNSRASGELAAATAAPRRLRAGQIRSIPVLTSSSHTTSKDVRKPLGSRNGILLHKPVPDFVWRRHPIALSSSADSLEPEGQAQQRLPSAMPSGDALDKRIASLALPAAVSSLILPLVGMTDTFWVGQMGEALALAGQSAADRVYITLGLLTNTIAIITTPRVAEAKAANDTAGVQDAVGEALLISCMLGIICSGLLWMYKSSALLWIGNPNALGWAEPYALGRLPGLVGDTTSLVGSAAVRGVMDTLTPLQITFTSSLVNVLLDPLLMFTFSMGMAGAGIATSASQIFAAFAYLSVLLRRKLVRWGTIFKIPSLAALKRIIAAGGAMQIRSLAFVVATNALTRKVQRLDDKGVVAAASVVSLQLWQLGGYILFAISSVAAIIIPVEMNTEGSEINRTRAVASRLLVWGIILGTVLGAAQLAAVPLLGVFTTLPEVRKAAVLPCILGGLIQPLNAFTFIGEGIMVGTQSFNALAIGQVFATSAQVLFLSRATLPGVWFSWWVLNSARFFNVILYFFVNGPLAPAGSWVRYRQRRVSALQDTNRSGL